MRREIVDDEKCFINMNVWAFQIVAVYAGF